MINNPLIDMLIRMKNAQLAKHEHVLVPMSHTKFRIAEILKESGFLVNIEKKKKKARKSEHEYILMQLKYKDGDAGISGIKVISKPSRKIYISAKDIKPVRSGYGISILSTPKGIMNSKEAKKQNLGGELLFEIW